MAKSSEGTKAANCSSSGSTTKLSLQITEVQGHRFGRGRGTPFWGTEGPAHPVAGLQHLCCWRTGVGADPAHTTPSTAAVLGEEVLTRYVLGQLDHSAVPPRWGQQLRGQCLAVWGMNHTQSFCYSLLIIPKFFWRRNAPPSELAAPSLLRKMLFTEACRPAPLSLPCTW